MSYCIELETGAVREFRKLSRDVRVALSDVLDDLARNPRPPGAKKLINQEGYRIRKGDYRILYIIDDQKFIVRIYRIGHRREVYRNPR